MTLRQQPGATSDERAAAPVPASPRRAATWSMWMWRSAVVLPHPALLPRAGEAPDASPARPADPPLRAAARQDWP